MGFLGDAWDWTKGAAGDVWGAAGDVWGGVKDITDYDSSYTGGGANGKMDPSHFYYGGAPDAAEQDAAYYRSQAQGAMRRDGAQLDPQAYGLMMSAAQGNQPSAAELQMRQGMNDAIAAQYAQANSARGGGAAMAASNLAAQRNAANMMSSTNQQAAAMRAQEMAANRGQLLQAAGYNANLAQQQHALNDQYSLGLEKQRGDVRGAQLDAYGRQEQLKADAATGADKRKADMLGGLMGSATGMVGGAMQMASDMRLKMGIAPEGISSDITGKDVILPSYSAGGAMGGSGAAGAGAGGLSGAFSASPKGVPLRWGVQSDERSKEGMVREFEDAIHPYSYEYKNAEMAPNGQPGRHIGVMAQDVERSQIGDQIVQDTPHGKMLNGPELLSANTAAIADLHQRLKQIEARGSASSYGKKVRSA